MLPLTLCAPTPITPSRSSYISSAVVPEHLVYVRASESPSPVHFALLHFCFVSGCCCASTFFISFSNRELLAVHVSAASECFRKTRAYKYVLRFSLKGVHDTVSSHSREGERLVVLAATMPWQNTPLIPAWLRPRRRKNSLCRNVETLARILFVSWGLSVKQASLKSRRLQLAFAPSGRALLGICNYLTRI